MISAALQDNTLTLLAYETNAPSHSQTVEIYLVTSTAPTERSFLISVPETLSSDANSPTTINVTVPGLGR